MTAVLQAAGRHLSKYRGAEDVATCRGLEGGMKSKQHAFVKCCYLCLCRRLPSCRSHHLFVRLQQPPHRMHRRAHHSSSSSRRLQPCQHSLHNGSNSSNSSSRSWSSPQLRPPAHAPSLLPSTPGQWRPSRLMSGGWVRRRASLHLPVQGTTHSDAPWVREATCRHIAVGGTRGKAGGCCAA